MKKVLTALAIVALAAVANTTAPGRLKADPPPGDKVWNEVCCGALCPGGVDYCIGSGTFVCCK